MTCPAVPNTGASRNLASWLPAALPIAFATGAAVTLYGAMTSNIFAHSFSLDERMSAAYVSVGVAAICAIAMAGRILPSLLIGASLLALGLAGAAATTAVLLLLASAYVIGDWAFCRFAPAVSQPRKPADEVIIALLGAAMIMLAMALLARVRIHYPAFYFTVLGGIVFIGRRRLVALLTRSSSWNVGPSMLGRGERVLLIAVVTCFALHWVVMLKPEVGYDALAMHLVIPYEMIRVHKWSFDVTRFVWAVMPMGGDWWFTNAFMLGGEAAARLANVLTMLAGWSLLYALMRRVCSRPVALTALMMYASTPMLYLESGTLFIEHVLVTLLLGGFYAIVRFRETAARHWLFAAAVILGASVSVKLIAVFIIAPIALWLIVQRASMGITRAEFVKAGILMAAWALPPFVTAAIKTHNPFFPFYNSIFKSPYFDATTNFTNALYVTPLRWNALWDLTFNSHRFLEGYDGSFGLQYLAFLPLGLVALLIPASDVRRWRLACACLIVALVVFFGVYTSQAYIRYLYPATAVLMVTIAYGLERLGELWPRLRIIGVLAALAVAVANVDLIPTASWWNTSLCLRCAIDPVERAQYVRTYAPERAIVAYLNDTAPNQRVGFFRLNSPLIAGYRGETRSDSWHDVPLYTAILQTKNAEDIARLAREQRLTYFVFPSQKDSPEIWSTMGQFRDRYTRKIYESGGLVVAEWAAP